MRLNGLLSKVRNAQVRYQTKFHCGFVCIKKLNSALKVTLRVVWPLRTNLGAFTGRTVRILPQILNLNRLVGSKQRLWTQAKVPPGALAALLCIQSRE